MAEVAASSHETPEWATRKRRSLAPAIVIKWDDSAASVICPFPTCEKLHRHGSNRARAGYPNRRLSHCDKVQQEYQLVWPFEPDSIAEALDLGFELDRDAGVWRTIGTDIEDPEADDILEESAQGSIQDCPSERDLLISLDRLALNENDYSSFVSHCVTNEIEQATLCLTRTTSAHAMLHRKNSDGNTALALTCMEGHIDMVKFLVEQGSSTESKNREGETPLIISLQCGQDEVASYLVSYGAAVSSIDRHGISVLSHARSLIERLEENWIHLHTPSYADDYAPAETKDVTDSRGNIVLSYQEDPNPSIFMRYQAHQEKIDRVRSIIDACTIYEATQKRIRKHRQSRARQIRATKVSISPSAVTAMVTLFRDAYQIPMAEDNKTFGYLERGEAHNLVFAVSGWSGGQFADIDGCIDREIWTDRVFEFSRIVGHRLRGHEYDGRDREGSFHACHAEKQLMAFVLWHYTSLQWRPPQEGTEEDWMRYDRMSQLHHCTRNSTCFVETGGKQCKSYRGPPLEALKPVIYVTRPACEDCTAFRAQILECTGIDITLRKVG